MTELTDATAKHTAEGAKPQSPLRRRRSQSSEDGDEHDGVDTVTPSTARVTKKLKVVQVHSQELTDDAVVRSITTILPDDDDADSERLTGEASMEEDDADSGMDDVLDIPQTPESNGTHNALQMDPSDGLKTHSVQTNTLRTSLESADLVFQHGFPYLTDKTCISTPIQTDAHGQPWRVAWYPYGQSLENKFVSLFVEMVVDDENDPVSGDTTDEELAISDRHVQCELMILHPRDHEDMERNYVKKSGVITFTKEQHEFGMTNFISRERIADRMDTLYGDDGDVLVQVSLRFFEPEELGPMRSVVVPPVSPIETMDDDDDLDPSLGYSTPVVTPTASASGLSQSPALAPHNLLHYDSKKETGMVGLKNQGATCYMNSLLQTLFHLRAFRNVVYETPSEQEDTNDSVSLALQRVFYRLQTQNKAVSTKELTRSFGWSQMDAFMQHDVQELYRILCDRLEEKMKNTAVDNAIKRLFEGKVRSFVQCVDVDFQSFRDESFYDLQLDVKGCKDIYDSFRKYVEIEMLQGDNQYEAEGHGKQDAKKGVRFLDFPPVLNIQLKRFEYDPMRDGMVKIHDRFEFPKTLVLDEFAPSADDAQEKSQPAKKSLVYHLHSVLVHSGDVHGGHYYVFIRPNENIADSNDWFKFDDDQITRVEEQYALEGSYGSSPAASSSNGATTPSYSALLSPENANGSSNLDLQPLDAPADDEDYNRSGENGSNGPQLPGTNNSAMLPLARSFSSAYMLVYVRDGANDISLVKGEPEVHPPAMESSEESAMSDIANDVVGDVPIPNHLLERFHEEEKAAARRKKQQQTEHLYMNFRIASDQSIARLKRITKNIDFSLFGNNSGCVKIRIKRDRTVRELYQRIAKRTGVPIARQRLWKVITRENRTNRPDTPVTLDMLSSRVDSLIDEDASTKAPVRLYLQIVHDAATNEDIKCRIHRHFLDDFETAEDEKESVPTSNEAPTQTGEAEEDENDDASMSEWLDTMTVPAPDASPWEILLFVKFYDVKKPLSERLEYKGNIIVDSRKTGAELAKYLHEALEIPLTKELVLYEEIQPMSVHEIDMDSSLMTSEIQHGDMVCYQYANDGTSARKEKEDAAIDGADSRKSRTERYPDVPSYFQYLLDRVDVTFQRYGHPEDDPVVLPLLFSNVYNDIIDSVANHLGLLNEKRLYLRLYQHSPLNGLPKKNPLRHSRYADDERTTLEEFLTEYSERTTTMYYEILSNPITEIEAKKQVLVYFSIYDSCFVDPSAPRTSRRVEFLVLPNATIKDLVFQIRQTFELGDDVPLRVCEVTHNGTLLQKILEEPTSLEPFWSSSSSGYNTVNDSSLFVEVIPDEEVAEASKAESADDSDAKDDFFQMGVVHFNFQTVSQLWIHPHGVPFVIYFRESDTVRLLKERMRRRMQVSEEMFSQWNMAFVKEIKASTLKDLYDDMEAEAIDDFTMGKLKEICGARFENVVSIGLEHADSKPATPKYARRQEQGIRIRQS
ncbi:hypothetical protein Poli38472_002631 [Pythium oligandrum]|uniref:ubiquitinyl hydrolase 1 n=1 Tax=Pythium oligandrum TaxID=41045 RepID=A0A8K1FHA3_PYTOL|nr:hypothetical protein Poli38472_002631 [Pythium oligandrum]|eukprot:TMW63690.1 hypothetical protein Poli38472_002631 [Pythium oligandrum]